MNKSIDLFAMIAEMQRGFVISKNGKVIISNLQGTVQYHELDQTVEEFTDSLLEIKGLNFRSYSIPDNADIFVIGNHYKTDEEAEILFSLLSMYYQKPDCQQISAIVGVKFDKTVAKDHKKAIKKSTYSLSDTTDYEIRKALVTVSIKKSLQGIDERVYKEVTKRLQDQYNCYIPDCYDNPKYLNMVLRELYGDAYINIIKSIKDNLESFSSNKSIHKFILQVQPR